MNRSIGIFTGTLLIVGTALFISFTANAPDAGSAIVVELFTSEGCSSCPPADALVARIAKENSGKPVYIMAYHVDYWDRLGWKDPYSSAAFSKRQYQYAKWLKLQSVYTPQIVVNGQAEFVGSDEQRLRKALSNAKAVQSLDVYLTSLHANKAELQMAGAGGKDNEVLVACVQKSAKSEVKRGENNGRTLSHVNVVRSLQRINSGKTTIELPEKYNPANWQMIAFAQNTLTGEILGAIQIKSLQHAVN